MTMPFAVLRDIADELWTYAGTGRPIPAHRVGPIHDAIADLDEMISAVEAAYLAMAIQAGERPVLPDVPTIRQRVAAKLQAAVLAGNVVQLPVPRTRLDTISGCYRVEGGGDAA